MIGKRYEYDVMAACERDLWWFKILHFLTISKIKKYQPNTQISILDAGCGTGGLLEQLLKAGYSNVKGFDLSKDAIEYASSKGVQVQILDILQADTAYPPNSFDVVVSNDIFTVLPSGKDRVALEKLVSLLKPGGYIIINLAAGKEFRGSHDIAVSMTRRYEKKDIQALTNNLVTIKESTRWPFFLSPLIFGIRFWQRINLSAEVDSQSLPSDVKPIPSILNSFFYKLTYLEHLIPIAKPWGSSVFTVMQKPL